MTMLSRTVPTRSGREGEVEGETWGGGGHNVRLCKEAGGGLLIKIRQLDLTRIRLKISGNWKTRNLLLDRQLENQENGSNRVRYHL